jgi:hypothetical protein
MVLYFKDFINESMSNDKLCWDKITELTKNNPDWELKISPSTKFKDAYNAGVYFKGEYYAGIKGPCSLEQACEFYENVIERNK